MKKAIPIFLLALVFTAKVSFGQLWDWGSDYGCIVFDWETEDYADESLPDYIGQVIEEWTANNRETIVYKSVNAADLEFKLLPVRHAQVNSRLYVHLSGYQPSAPFDPQWKLDTLDFREHDILLEWQKKHGIDQPRKSVFSFPDYYMR